MFCLFCLTIDYCTNLFQNQVPHQNRQDFTSLCTDCSSVKVAKGEANPGTRMTTSLQEKKVTTASLFKQTFRFVSDQVNVALNCYVNV